MSHWLCSLKPSDYTAPALFPAALPSFASTLGYRDFSYHVLLLSCTHEKLLKSHYRNLRCLLSRAQPSERSLAKTAFPPR
ncbi:hypothetical protein E2C01_100915 [Portunus trituberculatus]|uniref:Uncharacterized protein n=1 Tax=Portunus trituberculatus TaxID=210409 RepID=A0A5B7KEJ7_PORTR|nr:hypothetical protein [Portunus trituberculatus]